MAHQIRPMSVIFSATTLNDCTLMFASKNEPSYPLRKQSGVAESTMPVARS